MAEVVCIEYEFDMTSGPDRFMPLPHVYGCNIKTIPFEIEHCHATLQIVFVAMPVNVLRNLLLLFNVIFSYSFVTQCPSYRFACSLCFYTYILLVTLPNHLSELEADTLTAEG